MSRITPPLQTVGIFSLRLPFVANESVTYRVSGERTFEDLTTRGIDPMELVYTPVGLTEDDYAADKLAGACIITLLSDTQKAIYVPDTYIDSYPDMGVVPHSRIILAVDLGILPDTYDLTRATQAIQTAVSDDTGVTAAVTTATAPLSDAITQAQYVQNLAARNAAIKNRQTDHALLLAAREQVANLTQANAQLIEMVEVLQQQIIDLQGTAPGG